MGHDSFIWGMTYSFETRLTQTFLDGYCSTAQGLLDWFEVDWGFTELLFIHLTYSFETRLIQTHSYELWLIGTHHWIGSSFSSLSAHSFLLTFFLGWWQRNSSKVDRTQRALWRETTRKGRPSYEFARKWATIHRALMREMHYGVAMISRMIGLFCKRAL